jgi:hypothetical protein
LWFVPYRTEESAELVCSSQNRGTFAHHSQKEEIPGRVLPVEYPKKIEYVGRVPGKIPAILLLLNSISLQKIQPSKSIIDVSIGGVLRSTDIVAYLMNPQQACNT